MPRIPQIYRAPTGGPLRWQDDVTGELPRAVHAFFANNATAEQLEAVRDYCEYYVNAPCWVMGFDALLWTALRFRVKELRTAQEITVWLEDALEVAINPF